MVKIYIEDCWLTVKIFDDIYLHENWQFERERQMEKLDNFKQILNILKVSYEVEYVQNP